MGLTVSGPDVQCQIQRYSLTPRSPAEQCSSKIRSLFHCSQLCKFSSCFSFVLANTPEPNALPWFCCSSPAPGASHTPGHPAAHGEIRPCRAHHPAAPSSSQPAALSSSQQLPAGNSHQFPVAPSSSHHFPVVPSSPQQLPPSSSHQFPAAPSSSHPFPSVPSSSQPAAGKSLADGALCAPPPGKAAQESLSLYM